MILYDIIYIYIYYNFIHILYIYTLYYIILYYITLYYIILYHTSHLHAHMPHFSIDLNLGIWYFRPKAGSQHQKRMVAAKKTGDCWLSHSKDVDNGIPTDVDCWWWVILYSESMLRASIVLASDALHHLLFFPFGHTSDFVVRKINDINEAFWPLRSTGICMPGMWWWSFLPVSWQCTQLQKRYE